MCNMRSTQLHQGTYLRIIATGISWRTVIHFKPLCATERIAEGIIQVIEAHVSRMRNEEEYRDRLKLQKKGLMHDLLSGNVRVKTKEIDS